MKLPMTLVFGLLIFFAPYPSLNLLPEQVSQDVQPVLSGIFALLSLGFYLKRGDFRASIPLSVIFPAVFLVGATWIYSSIAIVENNNTPISLVIERTLAFLIGPIFYLSGVGVAYICSKQPSRILKYFVFTLYILLIYGSIQLSGILLKSILGFDFIFNIEQQFRELVLTRAQSLPRLVFFIPEPSFLPSFLIFLVLTASTLLYFDNRDKSKISFLNQFRPRNFLVNNKRFLIVAVICAVIFSFSVLVCITTVVFIALFFIFKAIQTLGAKHRKKKLTNLVKRILLGLSIVILLALLFSTDYIELLSSFVSTLGPHSVAQRLSNLENDPSTLVRTVKLEALITCSVRNFPFGSGLGGYYNQSTELIRAAPSFQGLDIYSEELKLASQSKTDELFSVVFGSLCECGIFGFSGLFFMLLPSILSCVMAFVSPRANQASPLWPIVCASGITVTVIFIAVLPFALPYPWIVLGMCNYLLSGKVLISRNPSHIKAVLPYSTFK
jgi:ABC-type multidrug transport system fused ATPase/permease subunit